MGPCMDAESGSRVGKFNDIVFGMVIVGGRACFCVVLNYVSDGFTMNENGVTMGNLKIKFHHFLKYYLLLFNCMTAFDVLLLCSLP